MRINNHSILIDSEMYLRKFVVTVHDIPVFVERKSIKSIRLSIIPPQADVRLSVPLNFTDKQIKEHLDSKVDWIVEHQNIMLQKIDRMEQEAIQYVTGDSIDYLGRKLTIRLFVHEKPPKIEIMGSELYMYVRARYTRQMRESVLMQWYCFQLLKLLPPLVARWEQVLGVHVTHIGVRNMKSRWGSCSLPTCRVHFNSQLAKLPLRCVEYVVAHELTHILQHDHSKRFYEILDSHFEDAAELKRILRRVP